MKRTSCRHLWRIGLACLGGLTLAFVGVIVILRHEPSFYGRAMPPAGPAGREGEPPAAGAIEVLSRRVVTKAAACRASLRDGEPWGVAVTDAEVNGWLALDLPRNHPQLLPRGFTDPRIAFEPRHLLGGARVGRWPLKAVVSVDLEIVLRDVNLLAIAVDRARLGGLPLPRAAVLKELGRRIGRLGMATELRRLDGRPVLLVGLSAAGDATGRLESLALGAGELLLAGGARPAGGSSRHRETP